MNPIVLVSSHGDGAKVAPQTYLGTQFNAYRECVVRAGARWVPSIRANVIAIDRLPILRDALMAAGFDMAIAADLRAALMAEAESAAQLAADGMRRLAEADERLRATGRSLYPYQRDGVRWLAVRRAALLADTMGLGKTIQVLMALPPGARALIVAPAAVAANWITETNRWRPEFSTGMIAGRGSWRWPMSGELLVATYGSLPAENQEMIMPTGTVHLVADEAHMLKGSKGRKNADGGFKGGTQRVRRWFGVRNVVADNGGHVWLLTGTPLINRPIELWRVLDAAGLAKDAFGSYAHFLQMAGLRRGRFGLESTGDMDAEIPLALQKVSLRRDRETVLPDLPHKQRQIDGVEIADGDAIRMCDQLVDALRSAGRDVDALADMSQLAKDERSIVFEMLSRIRASLAVAKIPALLERVETYEDEETPLVVFSAHLEPLRALAARPGWALIDGSVSPADRAAAVNEFQSGRLRGIACSYAAGGVGITLTHAHHVLCVDLPWTPALLQQAEDRCCRIGQTSDSVHVRILAATHPVDMRVAELLTEKAAIIERTVEASSREEIGVDDAIARNAESMAAMAESTVAIADRAEADAREYETIVAGRPARARGEFTANDVPRKGNFRPPADESECAAAALVVQLAANDPDRAGVVNGVGFNKVDNVIGHSLADSLIKYGRLSDRQWAVVNAMAIRYKRQAVQS